MPRMLAIEWDDHEARAAVANLRGSDVQIEHALSIPLTEELSDREVGQKVAEALAELGISKPETLVGLGRANIELRVLTLPPAPPEDRPDLVRFQAQSSFTTLGPDWPLDYVELESDESGSAKALAAAISPDLLTKIREVTAAAELDPQRLVLRPFAAASILRRAGAAPSGQCVLMIDVVGDDADLTVLADGHVAFMRTVRVPQTEDGAVRAKSLLGEIRRTIVAAHNQMGDRRVEKIVVCGVEAAHEQFKRVAEDALQQPVSFLNPFDGVSLSRSLKQAMPAEPGRFAPLLGMLRDEAEDAAHAVDFLNPKRRPEPPSRRNQNVAMGAVAASVALILLAAGWLYKGMLDSRIEELTTASNDKDTAVQKANSLVTHSASLKNFDRRDVTWLDEIAKMAGEIPPAEEVIINDFSLTTYNGPGARMTLKGYVEEPAMVRKLESSLRYNNNVVNGKRAINDPNRDEYDWLFDVTVIVEPDKLGRGRPLGRDYSGDGDATPSAANTTADGEQDSTDQFEDADVDPDDGNVGDADNRPDDGGESGNEPDGNEPDGNEPDGNEPDGDEPEGSEPEGDDPDNDDPDEAETKKDRSADVERGPVTQPVSRR